MMDVEKFWTERYAEYVATQTKPVYSGDIRRAADFATECTKVVSSMDVSPFIESLRELFLEYKELADSGDAGNWAVEDTKAGKRAYDLLREKGLLP